MGVHPLHPPPPSWKIVNFPQHFGCWDGVMGVGRGVIFISLLYYMFQSILNTFVFGYSFGGENLIIFTDGG